jgi:hypothetical protein
MEELCIVTVLLQVAALVMGTEFNNVTKTTEQLQPPSNCFHQTPAACPVATCTYITAENDTAVCCDLNNFMFKEEMAGTVSFSLSFLTSSFHHHNHHLALRPFVGFRLLSQVSLTYSIFSCFLPILYVQLF